MALGKPSDPVRIYADDDVRLPRRLSAFLQGRIDALSEEVLNGQMAEKEYRYYTGQIAGLREALSECDRLGKELSGD